MEVLHLGPQHRLIAWAAIKVALAARGFAPSALQLLRPVYSWHSLWSQYTQLGGAAVQLAPGYLSQNFAEQLLLVGCEQSLDGRGTLKV